MNPCEWLPAVRSPFFPSAFPFIFPSPPPLSTPSAPHPPPPQTFSHPHQAITWLTLFFFASLALSSRSIVSSSFVFLQTLCWTKTPPDLVYSHPKQGFVSVSDIQFPLSLRRRLEIHPGDSSSPLSLPTTVCPQRDSGTCKPSLSQGISLINCKVNLH